MPLNKLSSLGIENRQLDWFRNDRHKRTQVVEFLSVPSSPEAVAVSFSTVNPGTAAKFFLQLNYLPQVLIECIMLMYADDTTLLFSTPQASSIEDTLNGEENFGFALIVCL